MILFGVNALWNIHPKKWLKEKWWLWGVAWIAVFAISFFWSDDKAYWTEHLQVKLPILLLPLSFAFLPAFSKKQLYIYTIALIIFLSFGIAYSMYFLFTQPAHYIEGYRFSNVLPTLPKNEHIRFTLSLALGVVWLCYMLPVIEKKWFKRITLIIVILWSLAIHIYAVRTGLLAFYLFIAAYLIFLLYKKQTRLLGFSLVIGICISAMLAFMFVPTLKNRVDHFKWSVQVFEEGKRDPNYGDIGRYISYDLAWKIIKQHPLNGVGAGDIFYEMNEKYDRFYPQIKKDLRLIPHNQPLIIAVASGIPSMLVFLIWLFYPLKELKKNRAGFFFFITWIILMIPIMVEPVLEIQFGIFVYLFFLLIQRQVMQKTAED